MEKKKTSKKKIILYTILVLGAISILIYDTYQIHFTNKPRNSTAHLAIEYENGGNILLANIKDNDATSLKIKIKNETDHLIHYKIAFADVVNKLENSPSVTYTFSKEKGNIEVHSGVFPQEKIVMNEGDVIDAKEVIEYVITVRVNNLVKEDLNKTIQASLSVIEEE